MSNKFFPSWDEYEKFVANYGAKLECIGYAHEWIYAMQSGWDPIEFERLYIEYVNSTQIKLKKGDNSTELKGRPLERISCYFLEKGGAVTEIQEIVKSGKWQVDGQGPLNKTALCDCWGNELCQKAGFQLYLETKNHLNAITNEEFSVHFRRMEEHNCNVGVFVSTSGYKIGRGQGIADSIHRNCWRDRFHILLVLNSLRMVAVDGKAPLAVLTQALGYAINDRYANDRPIQGLYSETSCRELAKSEFQRLASNDE
ncbi:MAG: hypothetical protein ACFFCP_17775 [Promethearchaeota archaeon]